MKATDTDLTEDGRLLLQQRTCLFAKVMFGAQMVGLAGMVSIHPWEYVRTWIWLYQVQTVLALGAWLICRSGTRTVRLVSRVEATMLLGTGIVSGMISRLSLPGMLTLYGRTKVPSRVLPSTCPPNL